jgi:hypothetical protein
MSANHPVATFELATSERPESTQSGRSAASGMPSEAHGKVPFEGKPERRAFALAGCGTRRISRSEVVRGGENSQTAIPCRGLSVNQDETRRSYRFVGRA